MTPPTGNTLRTARTLAGLTIPELARLANIDARTISRLERAGIRPVRGPVDALIRALKDRGVEVEEDGLSLSRQP
jgi:transcriptional regulator with XRE-family HTH domain